MSIVKQQGISLLELLLALAVASSMMVLGFRGYYTYQSTVALSQVGEQVGLILDAMRLYYYANCRPGVTGGGTLAQTSTNPYVVLNGTTNKLTNYMSSQTIQATNQFVNTSDVNTYRGYVAQFNLHTSSRIPANTYGVGNGSTVVGTVVAWTSQVAVETATTAQVAGVTNGLGGECGSTYNGSGYVYTCAAFPGGTATFVVFEQTPSYGSGLSSVNMPYLSMMRWNNLQYQNSQYQGYQSGGNNVDTSGDGSTGSYTTNYYYCGS